MSHDDRCGHGALLALDDALAAYHREVRPLAAETRPLGEALGRVLAAPVAARVDLPMYTQSAVDGYALRAADLVGAAPGAPRDRKSVV